MNEPLETPSNVKAQRVTHYGKNFNYSWPKCQPNGHPTPKWIKTDEPVTCKNCLKL
jgi:hypothetical protein